MNLIFLVKKKVQNLSTYNKLKIRNRFELTFLNLGKNFFENLTNLFVHPRNNVSIMP